ncbi:MAG: SelB C-terminal domain-containing protein [Deferribacterales bacterium]|nr:SelB C-terminal domain-containing protein [Deferribacterales bacterium]
MIKILIIEDNIDIAKLHERFTMKVDGYEVVGIANDIETAREMLDILKPDLILLDIYFPEKSGIDLLWEIRKKHLNTDVIIITAAKDADTLREGKLGGAFDYIIKPVILDRFIATLENYKKYHSELEKNDYFDQESIDRIFKPDVALSSTTNHDTPKGIDKLTLTKIIDILNSQEDEITASELKDMIGVSRNTARRYLEYLREIGIIDVNIDYGTIGRPEKKYILVCKKFKNS